jgi:hypothetical protein
LPPCTGADLARVPEKVLLVVAHEQGAEVTAPSRRDGGWGLAGVGDWLGLSRKPAASPWFRDHVAELAPLGEPGA